MMAALAVCGLFTVVARAGDLRLSTLDGAPVNLSQGAGPVVLAFWRSDCAPCILELRGARDYAAAARPGRLLFVGLQDAPALRSAAAKAGAPLAMMVRAEGAPDTILTEFGGAPPRLPLAVALNASGQVCARHLGLLGTDRVRAWVQSCGRARAGG
jgi:hypothetical protein